MAFKYETWLKNRLTEIKADLGLDDYTIEVFNEQDFIKPDLSWGLISVVVKHLTATKVYATTVEPLQIMIMSEENGLDAAQIIFSKFFQTYNFYNLKDGTTSYKFQVGSPVVLNNFNVVGAGQRSVLYVSATNYILENIADLEDFAGGILPTVTGKLFVDSTKVDVISFSLNYGMSGDTQPFPNQNFAKTVKGVQTLNISLTTPCISSTFITKVKNILNGTASGNTSFNFKFKLVGTEFNKDVKLISAVFSTAPDQTPSIALGFML